MNQTQHPPKQAAAQSYQTISGAQLPAKDAQAHGMSIATHTYQSQGEAQYQMHGAPQANNGSSGPRLFNRLVLGH